MSGTVLSFATLFLVVLVGAAVWAVFVESRAKRRNALNCCGRCGADLDGLTSEHRVLLGQRERSRVLVCKACRSRIRRNYIVAGVFFATLLVLGIGLGLYASLVHV